VHYHGSRSQQSRQEAAHGRDAEARAFGDLRDAGLAVALQFRGDGRVDRVQSHPGTTSPTTRVSPSRRSGPSSTRSSGTEAEPDAKFGTLVSRMVSFVVPFLAAWTVVLAVFYLADLPLGPGAGVHLP
jgi:putative AbgT family transporter